MCDTPNRGKKTKMNLIGIKGNQVHFCFVIKMWQKNHAFS